MKIRYMGLLLVLFSLVSCSNEKLYKTFELGTQGSSIRVYRDASGFATVAATNRLELYSPASNQQEQILSGREPSKLDIRFDETKKVLLVYYCGGEIDEVKNLIKIDGKLTALQPIVTDFQSDASSSSGCDGQSFYGVAESYPSE